MRRYGFWTAVAICWGISLLPASRSAFGWESDKAVNLRYFYVPYTDLEEEEGQISMNVVKTMAMVPVVLSDTLVILPGLSYDGLYLDYKDLTFNYPTPNGLFTEKDLPRNLHVIDLIMGGNIQWDAKWGSTVLLYPGIHSDLDDVSGKDIYFSGAAIATYQLNDSLALSAGIYYDDSFGHPQLLPLVGVQWQINDTLSLDAFLPQYLVFSYRPIPRLAVGLKCNVEGNQCRLSEGNPWNNTVAEYTQTLLGPFVDFYFTDHIVLRLDGGVAVARQFEFRDDDSSSKLYDGNMKDSGYAGCSLSYRF